MNDLAQLNFMMKDVIQYATLAVQSQERLRWLLGQNNFNEEAKKKAHVCLELLITQKAHLEGSDCDFCIPNLQESGLIELKQLTLMHVPSSLTPEVCDKFKVMVDRALKDQCKAILSITLLNSAWYELSQRERGEQAKHNILLVVFISRDEQFFSPANPQTKEQASVIDEGWFCAVELSHFGQALGRGRTRYLEAVHCREGADIFSSQHWKDLRQTLKYEIITGTRSFMEACLGQALGGVGKKKKNGAFKLKEGVTIFEICESIRLLELADTTLRLSCGDTKDKVDVLPHVTAVEMVKSFYTHTDPVKCKHDLFDLLMTWAQQLRDLNKSVDVRLTKSNQKETERIVGDWLMTTRLQGRQLKPLPALPDQHGRLVELMQTVGGPVAKLKPCQILLVAVAGSAMYNMKTPDSDVDYLVVYTLPTESLLSATRKLPECHENRGLDKTVEYGAYEARTFCEMLLKCSVVILELLYANDHEYTSPLWQELSQHKLAFVTEKAILQYLGLIKNNLKSIDKGKLLDSAKRDRKLFYQNFHKIHGVQHMMNGQVPPVKLDGDIREFVMNVRTRDDGEWSRDNVTKLLKEQYHDLREKLCNRAERLRENPDYNLCTNWLLSVRGLG
ncbi:unnamed protein product [Lymnaea stagnalis]|uniref:Polymerase nucleotidyl transferase domain-containing protein n=1 Tax=Lymnaea stagnalis TaxID=6523 RepID=A0AAV2IGY9_LYMST